MKNHKPFIAIKKRRSHPHQGTGVWLNYQVRCNCDELNCNLIWDVMYRSLNLPEHTRRGLVRDPNAAPILADYLADNLDVDVVIEQ